MIKNDIDVILKVLKKILNDVDGNELKIKTGPLLSAIDYKPIGGKFTTLEIIGINNFKIIREIHDKETILNRIRLKYINKGKECAIFYDFNNDHILTSCKHKIDLIIDKIIEKCDTSKKILAIKEDIQSIKDFKWLKLTV